MTVMSWTKVVATLPFLILIGNTKALNVTLEDGATYLGEVNAQDQPHGFGKLIQRNGDVFELYDFNRIA